MRDDFAANIIELLAKRVGHKCSNPNCRQPTSGPQADANKAINLGVAAHITAASPGGPRYDIELSTQKRKSISNGVWLCQNCAKLIDNDPIRFPTELLLKWKSDSETMAKKELDRVTNTIGISQNSKFEKLEKLMPDLLAEMKNDLMNNPLSREFILLKHGWVYNGSPVLAYYFEDHDNLRSKIHILQNLELAIEITFNNVERFTISEELADYLCKT